VVGAVCLIVAVERLAKMALRWGQAAELSAAETNAPHLPTFIAVASDAIYPDENGELDNADVATEEAEEATRFVVPIERCSPINARLRMAIERPDGTMGAQRRSLPVYTTTAHPDCPGCTGDIAMAHTADRPSHSPWISRLTGRKDAEAVAPSPAPSPPPPRLEPASCPRSAAALSTGLACGVLGASLGTSGVPVMLYSSYFPSHKTTTRSSVCIVSVPAQVPSSRSPPAALNC